MVKTDDLFRRYWGYAGLLIWSAFAAYFVNKTPFNLDEGAVKALLLDWSIGDQVANSAMTLGTPDMRAMLWLPLGYLWPGQLLAAKVSLILVLALTVAGLFRWRKSQGTEEEALLASGLLLIAPLTLQQLDTLSPGICLLAAFTAGSWLDQAYRNNPRKLGTLYFAQLAVCMFSVSLHPIGLVYPLSLLWSWRTAPLDRIQQRIFYAGVGFSVLLTLLLETGWHDLESWKNPIISAATVFWGPNEDGSDSAAGTWGMGISVLVLLLAVVISQRKALWGSLMGRNLLISAVFGAFFGDTVWSFLTLAFLLYGGLPWLLKPRALFVGKGFLIQRGWLLILLLLFCTEDMRADRIWFDYWRSGALTDQDTLIRTFADNVEQQRRLSDENHQPMPRIRVASQWPARTMIACRCDALPLPPATKDPQSQLVLLNGLSHLMLFPSDNRNLTLSENLAYLGDKIETIALQPGGVILQIKSPVMAPPQKH